MKRRGAAWVAAAGAVLLAAGLARAWRGPSGCALCDRPFHEGMTAGVVSRWGWTRKACCPGCGLHYLETRPASARRVWVTDYESGSRVDAEEARFVVGSEVEPCHAGHAMRPEPGIAADARWDRCLPSIIAFSGEGRAKDFTARHGGRVTTFAALRRRGAGHGAEGPPGGGP